MSVFQVLTFKEQFISVERLPPTLPYFVDYWQLIITAVIFYKASVSNSQQVVLKFPVSMLLQPGPSHPPAYGAVKPATYFTLHYYIWTAQFLIGALSI